MSAGIAVHTKKKPLKNPFAIAAMGLDHSIRPYEEQSRFENSSCFETKEELELKKELYRFFEAQEQVRQGFQRSSSFQDQINENILMDQNDYDAGGESDGGSSFLGSISDDD